MGTLSIGSAALEAAFKSLGAIRLGAARAGVAVANAAVAVLEWQRRASERHALMTLDMRMLRDIGMTPADVDRETRKPFWTP